METAKKMPRTSDQAQDNSDDLIAELARLIAEDVQGLRQPAEAADNTNAQRAEAPAPQVTATEPEPSRSGSEVVGLFGDRSWKEEAQPAPGAGRGTAHHADAHPAFESQPELEPVGAPEPSAASLDGVHEALMTPMPATQRYAASREDRFDTSADASPFDAWQDPHETAGREESAHEDVEPQQEAADPIADLIAAQAAAATYPASQAEEPAHDFLQYAESEPEPEPEPEEETDSFEQERPLPEEHDHFTVLPVFGVGSRSVDPVQRPEPMFGAIPDEADVVHAPRASDPLDEIEKLIGEAVRTGGSPRGNAQPRTPAVDNSDLDHAARSAEAAIATATAKGTARRENYAPLAAKPVEPDFTPRADRASAAPAADPEPEVDTRRPARRTGLRRALVSVAALVVMGAIGGGIYWAVVLNGGNATADAPVLAASTAPVKTEPEPATNTESSARSVVFNELEGNGDTGGETLVSRDETGGATGNEVSRIITAETPEGAEVGLVNRKVRTVTVRPDGTIVSGDDVVAGGEQLPVDRPDVPALPEGTETGGDDFQTASADILDQPVIDGAAAVSGVTDAIGAQIVAATDVEATAEPDAPTTAASGAPLPMPRLEGRSATPTVVAAVSTPSNNGGALDLIAGASSNLASAQPVAVPTTPAATASTSSGASAPAYVQLASQRTPEAAQSSLQNVQNSFSSVLGGAQLEVQRVDLADKGIYYRVRMPANSLDQANSVCNNIKSLGGDCFVRTE